MIDTLKGRGNRVFVLLGPFNEHMLTDSSRERYQSVKALLEEGLKSQGVEYFAPAPLASDQYGDASHPLAPGYETLARELLTQPRL